MVLDMQLVGAIASPGQLPVCPGNGMVMFDEAFSPEEVKQLTSLVGSPECQALVREETPHFRAAWLQEALGRRPETMGWALLQASWGRHAEDFNVLAIRIIDKYRAALAGHDASFESKARASAELIIVEMLRRLGRFEDARAQLERVRGRAEMQPEHLQRVINQQLALIAKRDDGRHMVGAEPDTP